MQSNDKKIAEKFTYDVFISHSSKDKPAVRELARRLKADGLRVWFDEWEIKPGDMIGLSIEQGLGQSRTLVLVMSKNAFASEWVKLERNTAIFRDPTKARRGFISLRLDDVIMAFHRRHASSSVPCCVRTSERARISRAARMDASEVLCMDALDVCVRGGGRGFCA